jgi:diguanylate cyclase (GGDEF)-like protein/PAS domain S-box-containing protein
MSRILLCLTAEHDLRLVLVAGVVCLLASLTAIMLLQRARATAGQVRWAWIVTAGAATGLGIWATHFIAMLAYDPGVAVAYEVGLTLVSLLAACAVTVVGSAIAVNVRAPWAAALGGGLVGGGVATMHYLGMAALQLPGYIEWSADLVAASVLLGFVLGAVGLAVAMRRDDAWSNCLAAGLLTLAIVSHHFTAMGAVEVVADFTRVIDPFSLSPTSLALAIAAAALAVVGMCLVGALVDRRSDHLLREKNMRLDAALNNMCQGLCMFDAQARLVICNQRYRDMYRLPPGTALPGHGLQQLLAARVASGTYTGDVEHYVEELRRTMQAGRTVRRTNDPGDGRLIEVVNEPMAGGGWVATHEDVTEKLRAQQALEQTREFLDAVIENVPSTLVVKDVATDSYVLVNRAGEDLFGIPREQMIGKTPHDVFPPHQAEGIAARDADVARSGRELIVEEFPLQTPGHGTRLVNSKRLTLRDHTGDARYILGVIEDITERKRAEERIAHMARHDALTNLQNRSAFNDSLEQALARARAEGGQFAVLCLDLDRFKEVNDVFGHATGDALLRQVAARLCDIDKDAVLARVGGDEFMVIAGGAQPAAAEQLAERIVAAIQPEFEIDGHPLRIGITVGVAVFPTDGHDGPTLVANADAALYRAKGEARGSIRFFEAEMDKHLRDRRALQQDLRAALARGELSLHYQPQALIDGKIVGFEALVRWTHPARGRIAPGEFISIAEESGLIISMGEWILREACREAASWPRPLQIAVNLSPVQFQHGDLVSMVHTVLLETGLSPGRLELEITEGVLIGDFSRALSVLRRLKALGVRIAMDDFGTGYSSLSYLQAFPFDKIKIDQAFISNLEASPQSAAIIRAVIGLGRGLDLPVVAEGVETPQQLEFLSQEACDEIQGFLIGRPRPIQDYADLVGNQPPAQRARAGG